MFKNILSCIGTAFKTIGKERRPPRLEHVEHAIKASAMVNSIKASRLSKVTEPIKAAETSETTKPAITLEEMVRRGDMSLDTYMRLQHRILAPYA